MAASIMRNLLAVVNSLRNQWNTGFERHNRRNHAACIWYNTLYHTLLTIPLD